MHLAASSVKLDQTRLFISRGPQAVCRELLFFPSVGGALALCQARGPCARDTTSGQEGEGKSKGPYWPLRGSLVPWLQGGWETEPCGFRPSMH